MPSRTQGAGKESFADALTALIATAGFDKAHLAKELRDSPSHSTLCDWCNGSHLPKNSDQLLSVVRLCLNRISRTGGVRDAKRACDELGIPYDEGGWARLLARATAAKRTQGAPQPQQPLQGNLIGTNAGAASADASAVIVAALVAGSARAGNSQSAEVADAYAELKELLGRLFSGRPDVLGQIAGSDAGPGPWQQSLARELTAVGPVDPEVINAAQGLLTLIENDRPASRFAVTINESQGVVVGNGNKQVNYWGGQPPK